MFCQGVNTAFKDDYMRGLDACAIKELDTPDMGFAAVVVPLVEMAECAALKHAERPLSGRAKHTSEGDAVSLWSAIFREQLPATACLGLNLLDLFEVFDIITGTQNVIPLSRTTTAETLTHVGRTPAASSISSDTCTSSSTAPASTSSHISTPGSAKKRLSLSTIHGEEEPEESNVEEDQMPPEGRLPQRVRRIEKATQDPSGGDDSVYDRVDTDELDGLVTDIISVSHTECDKLIDSVTLLLPMVKRTFKELKSKIWMLTSTNILNVAKIMIFLEIAQKLKHCPL
ncbi:hypothetical protein BGX27_001541 [Mortierella sp. AM989]|nr:hypothetical protein BGX27_001541 [Mortierella sp. AM989]